MKKNLKNSHYSRLSYSVQQLQINENTYVQNEFMKQNNFQWLKELLKIYLKFK